MIVGGRASDREHERGAGLRKEEGPFILSRGWEGEEMGTGDG